MSSVPLDGITFFTTSVKDKIVVGWTGAGVLLAFRGRLAFGGPAAPVSTSQFTGGDVVNAFRRAFWMSARSVAGMFLAHISFASRCCDSE